MEEVVVVEEEGQKQEKRARRKTRKRNDYGQRDVWPKGTESMGQEAVVRDDIFGFRF